MTFFLDTNVLIDFIIERDDFYHAAASIMSYAVDGKVTVAVSSLSMVNANYICVERCDMPLAAYRKKVDFLRRFISVYGVEASDIYNSYDGQSRDFEDGVQFYCAKRNDADFIVTRNKKDFKDSDVEVVSPDEAISIIEKIA